MYEAFKDTVIARVRAFFRTCEKPGTHLDPEYTSHVRKRKKNLLAARLDWLRDVGAIDTCDIDALRRVRDCRNALAHDLLSSLCAKGLPDGFAERFREMVDLFNKLEVWWIRNVEMPTNPEFDDLDPEATDVVPGTIRLVRLLCATALGDDDRSRAASDE